jgi:manganese/zinc/iron transport system permease protein
LLALQALTRRTRLTEDTAIGAVLSVSYGLGVVILTVIQTLTAGRPAGLEGFILGSTAGMLRADVMLIAGGAVAVLAVLAALRRPLVMVAFDRAHAEAVGVRAGLMDAVLMALVLAVVLIGIRVVGAILIVALLITPAVTARLWTDRAGMMAAVAGAIGGLAGYGGAALSAAVPGLPTGAVIVLIAAAAFAVSAVAAPGKGLLARGFRPAATGSGA